jgi:F0F1-type ATP synthase assembly protein I
VIASLVLGLLISLLGSVCIAAGAAIAVVDAFRSRPSGSFPVGEAVKIGQLLVSLLKAFAKLTPVGQLLASGLIMLGVGLWLLTARPF